MNMKGFAFSSSIAMVALSFCVPATAALVTLSESYSVSQSIPDQDSRGVTDTRTFNLPGATAISDVQVMLDIAGGFNGDYYAFLRHGSTGFAVLLNRVGVTAANHFGYADSGMNVTLSSGAFNGDIHLYRTSVNPNGATLTGCWQPDGRNSDPNVTTDRSPRSTSLCSFTGMDPNGDWTLFVADDSQFGVGTLRSWGLSVTAIVPVPELPTGLAGLLALGMAVLQAGLWRKKGPRAKAPYCERPL
jgi:subtilisin-like proprotein convertase family protein